MDPEKEKPGLAGSGQNEGHSNLKASLSIAVAEINEKSGQPHPTNGFVPLYRYDVRLITENCGATSPTVIALWYSLCDIANTRKSLVFQVSLNLIAHVAGVSQRTARRRLPSLVEIGLLAVEYHPIKGARSNDISTYQLYPHGQFVRGEVGHNVRGGVGQPRRVRMAGLLEKGDTSYPLKKNKSLSIISSGACSPTARPSINKGRSF